MATFKDSIPLAFLGAFAIWTIYSCMWYVCEIPAKEQIRSQYYKNGICDMFLSQRSTQSVKECYERIGEKKR